MKIKSLLIILTIICFFSCEKEEEVIGNTNGDIYVTVTSDYGTPVEGATVFTVPASKQGVTDKFGSVMITDIKAGSYEIYASLKNYGSDKSGISVKLNTLENITIRLIKGAQTSFPPQIQQSLPALPANFAKNEKVIFSFNVTDSDSPAKDIYVTVNSSLDGKLFEGNPDSQNNVKFEKSTLSRGLHQITIKATDKDGYYAENTFTLSTLAPSNIQLKSVVPNAGTVTVNWEKYAETDFLKYEIYRTTDIDSPGQIIATINSADSVSYIDKTAPLTAEAFYYVLVYNKENQFRKSNILKASYPGGKIFFFGIKDAVHHPSEPIVYLVNSTDSKLVAINYETGTEIGSTFLLGPVGNIDIADNGFGLELYVPSDDGHIYIYNASTLKLAGNILTGLPTKSVVSNGHGYLAASVCPSPWWEKPVRTYSRLTGINISGNGGFEGDILRFIPNTDNIISISQNVSPVDMEYFELDQKGNILTHKDDIYHGDHPLNPSIFRISTNGEYVVTGMEGAVYSKTMVYKGQISRASLNFSDFAFSPDGNTIYAGTSNRTSIQIANYPELTRTDEYLLKGYPQKLFYYNGKLISISKTSINENTIAIETVKIK